MYIETDYNFFCKKLSQAKFHEFLSKEDYENICYNVNYKIEFMDIDKNIDKIILSGIQEFLIENKYELYKIFNDRKVIIELIRYLKTNKKVTYVAIRNFLSITRGSMQKLIAKSKKCLT